MTIDKTNLSKHYSSLTDDSLLELYSESNLVEEAKEILINELNSRGISTNQAAQASYVSAKDIDKAIVKQRGGRILWRIFWRAVFPLIVLFFLVYLSKIYDWITAA